MTCRRCGRPYMVCDHVGTPGNVDREHAKRIRAAYLIGKQLNPDHDTTSYYDQTKL